MQTIEVLILSSFLIALTASLCFIPLTIFVFKKMGWTIDPKKNKHPAHVHKTPVPKGGGVAIFLAVALALLFVIKIDKHVVAILIAMMITLIVGVWDDIKGSGPYRRIALNILAAGVVVASGIGISYLTNPFGGVIDLSFPRYSFEVFGKMGEIWLLPDLFALIWIPFLMNAINWSSGVDGQVSGVMVVAAIAVGLLSLNYSADITQWPVAVLAFSMAGAFLGLAFFSFYPQKIMPGYSATSLAGLLLGVMSILSTAKVGTLIMVLGIPVVDALYVMGRRVLSGKSPVWGDRGHLHHRLMDMGWGKRRIAVFYWLTALMLGTVALQVDASKKLLIMLGLGGLMVAFLLWRYLLPYLGQPDRDSG
jgi:UDP-GlcNAc:undecaprenyl-phosphate/decaprenyl-phosphate GlcNAc-1-phosphate transferase